MNLKTICKRSCFFLWLTLFPVTSFAEAIPVELNETKHGWQLLRGGQPYFIQGAGGKHSLEELAKAGGNSVRTWGADDLAAHLDEAHALGLSVTVGIWLGHERHGFDYDDKAQVKKQFEYAKQIVMEYKDHPAVLIWGIGNEMEGFKSGSNGDNPVIWKAVNDIAAMVKKIDPLHPTMTVTADIGGERIKNIHQRCPAIDIHGINSYGGALSVVKRYKAGGAIKPFVLTEFGPAGSWETAKTEWGAPIELTSTEKANSYRRSYESAILNSPDMALGSYAFAWGFKMEATRTWFGMFLPDGARLGAVDVMSEIWTGKPPETRVPTILPLKVDGDTQVNPGAEVKVHSVITNPEDSKLKVRWVLTRESDEHNTGGDFRPMSAGIEGAIIEANVNGARIRMPDAPGPYRLYLYAYNTENSAATANIPLLVKGEVRTLMPFSVYEEGFEYMPWYPSGWMGRHEFLTLDGENTDDPHEGKYSIKLRYTGKFGWVGIAWQNPSNNWGEEDGGYDLRGATHLELWARGKYVGERISIGVGIIGKEKAYPDSGIAKIDDIALTDKWTRYRLPLTDVDLSSIKTGFVLTVGGQSSSVNVYLDSIRFIHE